MTYDHNQLDIPDSFLALFIERGRLDPTVTRAEVTARYELCEDLAGALLERARARHHDVGLAQEAVLGEVLAGLRTKESGLAEKEAVWTVRRLAELEGWSDAALGLSIGGIGDSGGR